MRSWIALALAVLAGGCAVVESPPRGWPEPEPRTPGDLVELMRRCRETAGQRGVRANHALRAEAALVWFTGASLAGGAVTTTLAGLEVREREGMIGAAVLTTASAGVALAARFVEPSASARARYEATRAHERAASEGLILLAQAEARLAGRDAGVSRAQLLRRRELLREHVVHELSSCVALDPGDTPAPPP